MNMTTKRVSSYVQSMLILVYENRAITLEQLSRKLNRTMNGIYCKVNRLQKAGLLETESVTRSKGYGEVHKQGKYVYITDKGITVLKNEGYNFKEEPRRAKQIKPTRSQLAYVILSNEISFELNGVQWEFLNSRDAKQYLNRRTNELLDGLIRSKETGELYGIYITLPIQTKDKTPSERYTGMLSTELTIHYEQMNSNTPDKNLNQYIFFCKDIEWYRHLIKHIPTIGKGSFLSKVKSIRVLPFETGKYLLKTLAKNELQNAFQNDLTKLAFPNVSFETSFEITKVEEQLGMDFKIAMGGETYFGVNLIDMDLKKIHRLKRYTEYEYEKNGKTKVILFTTGFNNEIVRDLIPYPYVSVVDIELYKIIQLLGTYE